MSKTARPSSTSSKVRPRKSDSGLKAKEEEYHRLNAEIGEKTASLVREAEEVLRGRSKLFGDSPGERTSSQEDGREKRVSTKPAIRPQTSYEEKRFVKVTKRPSSARSFQQGARPPSGLVRPTVKHAAGSLAKEMTKVEKERNPFSGLESRLAIATTISKLENSEKVDGDETVDDEVLPLATGIGSEATIRLLKAKLRVLQEEMDRVSTECVQKDEKISSAEVHCKELLDEKTRLQRQQQAIQGQVDKYKKLHDEAKQKIESLEAQLVAVRKELESMRKSQKQAAANQSTVEVRLNRALEEVEKYKASIQKVKTDSKDSSEQERRKAEQLISENKRLEKQKTELMTAFKKQLKLIDILKKQKMHIEAAKLLSFSEEEFVKALDWGT
ncbi:testis-expressed protein 9-like isoform X2 [Corticium candelabrum]|uniref:testis-expressed protein 9-like isoform X2 n=1 Tax=Corticium candelabrum TaxID=121492 RepID=UPI002E263ADE|nr:testis-expressed protein 9-like isoform X2 [Corticium candelabrum]